MLILTRRDGESLIIGNDIRVTIQGVKGNQVRIGIEAPDDVTILREELYDLAGDAEAPRQDANAVWSEVLDPLPVGQYS